VPTSGLWGTVIGDALGYAATWVSSFSPVLAAFVALGVLGLAITIIRRVSG